MLRLGEITPFDAIKLTGAQHIEKHIKNVPPQLGHSNEKPAAEFSKQLRNQLRREIPIQQKKVLDENVDKKSAPNLQQETNQNNKNATSKRTQKAHYEESAEEDDDIGNDKDYVPTEAVYSSDDNVDDPIDDLTDGEDEGKPINKKQAKKENTKKVKKGPKKSHRIIDDGDFNSFRERMR